MLEDLNIRNFALIDSVSIEFSKGFTVLSGETGAGKSILIGALSFLLGGKASVEQIRAGTCEASVSGTFLIAGNSAAHTWLDARGISIENDRVLLRRVIKESGKSSAWIEGTPVTRTDMGEFSLFLVDIHGQHEHQSLMHPVSHRVFLDSFAGIVAEVESFTALYGELIAKRRLLEQLSASDRDRQQRTDLLTFALEEIDGAQLKSGEEEALVAEETRLSSYEKLYSDLEGLDSLLGSGDGAVSLLKKARSLSSHAAGLDRSLSALDGRLESAFYELSDIADEFRSYTDSLVYDPQRLEQVQDRLNIIHKLKKKYAQGVNASVQDVLDYAEKSRAELEQLDSGEANRGKLLAELEQLEARVYNAALAISKQRAAASESMARQVEAVLATVGMKSARFSVGLRVKETTDVAQKCGPYGMDDVEFLISANPGSPLLPLARIASGGELSRVMLALKTVLAAGDSVGTLVFDEIDTGIGGEVAVAVGGHIKKLSASKQILCITHLASIAVYADNQIKIQKSSVQDGSSGSTSTDVFPIEGEQRVAEIARMLSGDAADSQSLEHARSMLVKCGGFNG